jgi:excinuclease UvrABC helicase subunit UvrB
MFGKRKWLSEFDSMFNELNSMFNSPTYIQGKSKVEEGSDEHGKWTKETFTSNDGTYSVTSIVRVNDSTTTTESDKTLELKNKLQKYVENQEFEKAAELRDQIKNLEKNNKKITDLKEELQLAISKENFERAIELRDEIKKLEK